MEKFFNDNHYSPALVESLINIKNNYLNYDIRDKYIIEAMYWATKCDLKVGIYESKFIIDLPVVGQVSWYMQDNITFDHHSNDIKDKRINEFISKLEYLFNEAFSCDK